VRRKTFWDRRWQVALSPVFINSHVHWQVICNQFCDNTCSMCVPPAFHLVSFHPKLVIVSYQQSLYSYQFIICQSNRLFSLECIQNGHDLYASLLKLGIVFLPIYRFSLAHILTHLSGSPNSNSNSNTLFSDFWLLNLIAFNLWPSMIEGFDSKFQKNSYLFGHGMQITLFGAVK
jgi:hypothetical protein